jgi:hypothetical protein
VKAIGLSFVAVCALALPAGAIVTATWSVETYQQFDAGDATNAFITSAGEVRPGWDTKRTQLEGDAVWSSLRLADGSVLLGSDAGGAIYRVTDGAPKKVVAIDGAIAVVALAQAADGSVWAGAMPGNKVWKIDVGAGKATAGPQLGDKAGKDVETVWSLAAAGNTVYAGTGPSGKLFAISGGSAKEVFDTDDKRITALAVTTDGAVWMGTSDRALVFRLDPKDGKTRAMADFAGNEVSAIAAYRDGVVVAANDLLDAPAPVGKTANQIETAEKPTATKGQAAKLPDAGTKPGADKDPSPVTDLGRKGAKKGKGALFRVGKDGRLEQLHALTQTYFTSVVTTPDGAVYAGAADKGRVYMVDADDSIATAFDVDERSVAQLWLDKAGNLGFATDDAAAMYRVTGRAKEAKYVSDVLDAKAVSKYGRIAWVAQGKVKLETRTGNTAKPGVGWSEWALPAQIGKLGGGSESGKIANPPGRYLQFRLALEDDPARVRRVMAYYVPQNLPTQVQEVTVEPTKDTLPTLKDSAAKPRSPIIKVKWKIENPDGDETTYSLEARRDGEANWRPIATGKGPLTATSWDWNTETYPDGWYRVRVTASDAAANSPDRALTSSASTTMFAIDNTRPHIENVTVQYPRASAKATDALSTISEAAFSVDDGPWQLGASADGLYDDLSEDLRVELPASLPRGTHTLAIRAADSAGNVGSTSTTFVIK